MHNQLLVPNELVEQLRQAKSVAVLTGAGISAESGMPTFRDSLTGLWSNFNVEEMATLEGFRRNPQLVWQWYAERHYQAFKTQPNPGHYALVDIERHVPTFSLITQNIDRLHHRAGSQNITELHGNLAQVKCLDHSHYQAWPEENGAEIPPRCSQCNSMLRPNVVWFGENLPEGALEEGVYAAWQCDLFFSIGTSGVVEPAASLVQVAERAGATVVINNLEVEPLISEKRYHLNGSSGQLLPLLVQKAWPI